MRERQINGRGRKGKLLGTKSVLVRSIKYVSLNCIDTEMNLSSEITNLNFEQRLNRLN